MPLDCTWHGFAEYPIFVFIPEPAGGIAPLKPISVQYEKQRAFSAVGFHCIICRLNEEAAIRRPGGD